MSSRLSLTLSGSLLLLISYGLRSDPEPAQADPAARLEKVSLHVKDMTKRLKLA